MSVWKNSAGINVWIQYIKFTTPPFLELKKKEKKKKRRKKVKEMESDESRWKFALPEAVCTVFYVLHLAETQNTNADDYLTCRSKNNTENMMLTYQTKECTGQKQDKLKSESHKQFLSADLPFRRRLPSKARYIWSTSSPLNLTHCGFSSWILRRLSTRSRAGFRVLCYRL